MPSNQQPPMSNSQSSSASKSPLVRSKSLRLPSAKPKTEVSGSTLTRHGSIRQTKQQCASANIKQQPLSVLRKPLIKPKPVFSSKSTENLSSNRNSHNADSDSKKQLTVCRSPTKHADNQHYSKGVTFFNDNHPTPSDSPSSMHSERSQQSRDTSWTMPDLAVHVKRLTEEHEKLQVEYARQRMQVLELTASQPSGSLRRDLQHLSQSDSHLASIPENSPGSGIDAEVNAQNHEAALQIYRNEILKLQDENRKLQRKYWEQVLSSESIEDELNGGASQQVVDLIDKLDDKQRELLQSSGRVQELENYLATTTLELHQCQDALQDYQRMLEETNIQKEKLEKQLKEANVTIVDMRETVEFLQEERSTLAEALQETEQSLGVTQAEKKLCDTRLNELMSRARKLYAKVHDKNLQIQLLQAELDRTEGRARDMLLSQGAELTMTAMNLSEISITLHTILTSASDFAANELELQKEMLDEIMADLDSESDKNENCELSPLEDICQSFKILDLDMISPKDLLQQTTFPDVHKSLPDLPSSQLPSSPLLSSSLNGSKHPISIVHSIIRAAEGTKKKDPPEPPSQQTSSSDESVSNSVQSSSENLVSTASENNVSKVNFGRTGAFKPVGTAIPFRPVSQSNREITSAPPLPDIMNNDEEKRKASLEGQLNQMNAVLGKLTKVIELTQGKYLSKMAALKEEISRLQDELTKYKDIEKNLQGEVKFKSEQNETIRSRLDDTAANLKSLKQSFETEKGELLKEISEVKESNKCLEAENKELVRQLKEEVQQISDSALKKQGTVHFSDALAICDKLSLKQEIANLKEKISQKEQMLQLLAQKFARTKKVLEDNVQKADNEVECLDSVIQRVYESLQCNPDLVESSDVIQNIYMLVSGKNPPEEFHEVFKKDTKGV